jgi:hypothetical protein
VTPVRLYYGACRFNGRADVGPGCRNGFNIETSEVCAGRDAWPPLSIIRKTMVRGVPAVVIRDTYRRPALAIRTGNVRVTIRTHGGTPMGAIVAALRPVRSGAAVALPTPTGPSLPRGVDCAGIPAFGAG